MKKPWPLLLLVVFLLTLNGCEGQQSEQVTPVIPPTQASVAGPPLFIIHFFDWYVRQGRPINGSDWTYKIDWAKYGLTAQDVDRTKKYYDVQFDLLNKLGVDGISYETSMDNGHMDHPIDVEMESLKQHQVKVAAFYDWAMENAPGRPEPGSILYVQPTAEVANTVIAKLTEFYSYIPKELWLKDKQGKLPIMVFAYGFDTSASNSPATWQQFYTTLIKGLEKSLGNPVVMYFSGIGLWPEEYGFQHFPDNIRPYNFVMDSVQQQFGHAEVSWNFNYDNLGVQHLYPTLPRVIRDDPRYISEMYWLAKYTAPELVFIYSWNEFYEGANLMPDETYGDTRYNLAQAMIKDIRANDGKTTLPRTLLITDDYSATAAKNDWHDQAEQAAVAFPFRHYIPQADTMLASEVTSAKLSKYDLIVAMQRSNPALDTVLSKLVGEKQIIFYHPIANGNSDMTGYFADDVQPAVLTGKFNIVDTQGKNLETVDAFDDTMTIKPRSDAQVLLYANGKKGKTPLLIERGNDFWINYFKPDDTVLGPLFSAVYGRQLEDAILFGNGPHAQRTFVYPDGKVEEDSFSSPAVYQHLPLPIPFTSPPPAELPNPTKLCPDEVHHCCGIKLMLLIASE